MDRYYVFDNILDKDSLIKLQDYFVKNQNNLEWFYFESVVDFKSDVKKFFTNPTEISTKPGDGFVIPIPNEHVVIDKNIVSIIDKIQKIAEVKINKKFSYTLRTKINLTKPQTFSEEDKINAIHLDRNTPHISFIFYVNTNNGSTILYNDEKTLLKKVECVENRILIFDGLTPHAGIPSTNNDKCVINFNVIEKQINNKLI